MEQMSNGLLVFVKILSEYRHVYVNDGYIMAKVHDMGIDDNGKISDEERAAFADVNQLANYIDKSSETSVPSGNIYINTKHPKVAAFAAWVLTNGQSYLHQYGYLEANSKLTAQK